MRTGAFDVTLLRLDPLARLLGMPEQRQIRVRHIGYLTQS